LNFDWEGQAVFKKILAAIIVLASACSFALSADEFFKEPIGKLRLGLSESEVKKAIPCDRKRGPEQLWGADGAYHQEWVYADCGITLGMVSEKKGAPKAIESITLVSPSDLSTKSGIRIGSTEQEVMKVYASHWNKEDSSPGKTFVAGSVYGGLMFDFNAGTVSRIFLGAAAE
jgi:hypothetical protein